MKKSVILVGILVFLMFSSCISYAAELACPYWGDSHVWKLGDTWYEHDQLYEHIHFVYDDLGGVVDFYYDSYCKIYRVNDYYCACGLHKKISTYSSSHCHN